MHSTTSLQPPYVRFSQFFWLLLEKQNFLKRKTFSNWLCANCMWSEEFCIYFVDKKVKNALEKSKKKSVVQLFKIKCFQKLPKNQKNRKKLDSRTPTFAQRMKASRADLNSRRPSPHVAYHACRSHAPPTDLFSATQKTSILYISDPGCTFFVNIFLVN